MKISKEVKVLLGLGLVVVAYNYLKNMSKKNMGVVEKKPEGEENKSFMNVAGGTSQQVTVVNGVPYYCAKGELLQDANGRLACFIDRGGELVRVGNPIIAQTPSTTSL
jgi:hypothetical protein